MAESVPEHRDAPATSFRAGRKSGIGQAQYLYSLPEGPKFRYLLENQGYEGSLQKTHWCSRAKSGKIFGDLMTADHKVLSEGCEP